MRSVKKLLPATLATALAAVVAAGLVLGSSLHASSARPSQTPAPTQDAAQGPVIRSQVNLVNIFATVRDHSKRIVTDLKQQDFKIQEDGQDQQIAFFSREVTLPITLALLLDTSGSEQFMLGAIQDMGGQFLGRVLRKGDEALIMSFDTDVDLLADWTDDRGLLDRAIRKTRINSPSGGGMINPGPVEAIVVGTDAQDEGSKVRKEEAIEAAQRTDTVIHILLVADSRFGGNTGVARQMTEETGGRLIVANNEKHLQEAFDQISEELRSQYTLGYYPTNTARDGKFRKIKVDVSNHDDKVLARKGYYAPKG